MPDFDYDLGILGGGAAGLTAASGAAQLGAAVVLIEKGKALGGDCLHYGCVPSKTLIKTARVYHMMKNARAYGLPQSTPGRVDFRDIAARIKGVIDVIQKHDSTERFCSMGAKVLFGHARFKDEHTVELQDGRRISARSWLIATGSEPLIPPVEGLDKVNYITNRELFYLDELPSSMLVLGGGPIAIEMAQAFARLGTDVTVVSKGAQILEREDADMAAIVMESLKSEGVRFHTNVTPIKAREHGGIKELVIEDGSGTQTLTAQTLLVATGRAPNVRGMGLEDIGVSHSPRGIEVDARMRTSHSHIYAAGDATGKYMFTHAAGYEGGIVLANAIFRLPRKADYTNLPWCTYMEPELASIGLNEQAARAQGLRYSVWQEEFSANDRALAEGDTRGKAKLLLNAKGTPIGCQILGPGAGDLIGEWVAVMNGGVKLSTLAAAVHPYPTLAEISKRVAGDVLAPKIFSDKVRKGLRFFFSLKGRACGCGKDEN